MLSLFATDTVAAIPCAGKSFLPAVDEVLAVRAATDRFEGIDGFDGLILLGYHAMAGTGAAVLEHSMSSVRIQNYWINGEKAGETAIDAGIAGRARRARHSCFGRRQALRRSRGCFCPGRNGSGKARAFLVRAALLPPDAAHAAIRSRSEQAVRNIRSMQLLRYSSPVRLRAELTERQPLPNRRSCPGLTVLDGRTFEIEAPTLEDALFRT